MREKSDLVAQSTLAMGLDRFKPFLREADDHLTRVAAATGHREFRNPVTDEIVCFDKAHPGKPAFEGVNHRHRINPALTSKRDLYLDRHGNPVPKGSKRSHIIPGKNR